LGYGIRIHIHNSHMEARDFAYSKWETVCDNVAGNFVEKCNN